MKIAKDTPRNLLLCCGAYYISCWVGYPMAVASMPLVTAGLHALVAFVTGAIVAWLVDPERPLRWAIFLAALYVFFGTFGYQWAQTAIISRPVGAVSRTGDYGDFLSRGSRACSSRDTLSANPPTPHRPHTTMRFKFLITALIRELRLSTTCPSS